MIAIIKKDGFFRKELAELAADKTAFKAALFLAFEIAVREMTKDFCQTSKIPRLYATALLENTSKNHQFNSDLFYKSVAGLKDSRRITDQILDNYSLFLTLIKVQPITAYNDYCLELTPETALPTAKREFIDSGLNKFSRTHIPGIGQMLVDALLINKELESVLGAEEKASFLGRVSPDPKVLNQESVTLETRKNLFAFFDKPLKADAQEYVRNLREAFPDISKGK